MSTDFSGRSAFNLKLSDNRHWLTPSGTEWRNRLQIGEVPQLYSELYHPLGWTASRKNDWFVAGYAGAELRRLGLYDASSGDELATFRRSQLVVGADLGQPWGAIGELRLGWSRLILDVKALLVDARLLASGRGLHLIEDAVRAKVVVDQLDFAVFPQSGYRAALEAWAGRRSGDLPGSFYRLEGDAKWDKSLGPHTFELYAQAQTTEQGDGVGINRYSLGGFQRLSGYQDGQLTGTMCCWGGWVGTEGWTRHRA